MEWQKIDTLGDIGKLGFGLMRLPMLDDEIDIEQVKQMVDEYLAAGFNYFDTAFVYMNQKSESCAKVALMDRHPRESFYFATKMSAFLADSEQEARDMFDISLERTGAGYFDFYLLHNLGSMRTVNYDKYDMWSFLQEKKAAGQVRYVGFSFHDKAPLLDKFLTDHPWIDFVQLQINYADWERDSVQSRACYEVARKHGKPIVVMEPLKGGSLTQLPPAALDVLHQVNPDETLPGWALRFAASLPGVATVLSGMSNIEQLRQNVQIMRDFKPLTDAEQEALAKVRQILDSADTVPCTYCRYCADVCPNNITISGAFRAMNNYLMFGFEQSAKGDYLGECRCKSPASECSKCYACEEVCPQGISIVEELERAVDILGF